MIEFRGVTKVHGTGATAVRAVDNLSFTLPAGTFWALMGPSGSGKSTVLHLIAGLTAPTSGTVVVAGRDVTAMTSPEAAAHRRQRVGYVLQTFGLLPFLSVERNVAMPLVLDGIARGEIGTRVHEALAVVGMTHRARHLPGELSGGEQQRAAIARALVIRPPIVLADEPTGNLDRASGAAVMALLRGINERQRVTILVVTHDAAHAASAQRVVHLVDGALARNTDDQDDAPDVRAPAGVAG